MDTLEALGRRIATTRDLRSLVRTMRSLSAVSIRQYERAVEALRDYDRTVELGLQVVLRAGFPWLPERDPGAGERATVAVVLGSDHGLCGRFNREVVACAREELAQRGVARADTGYLVLGARAVAALEAAGETVAHGALLPGSVDGLAAAVHEVLVRIDAWRAERRIARVLVFYNRRGDGAPAAPHRAQLWPLDRRWVRGLVHRPWPNRVRPTFTMEPEALLASLVRQHLFVGLFRAAAHSGASEHAARLAAMQAAERNIEEHLEEMNAAYRRKRQESITEELLDVVAGFESLTASDGAPAY